MKKLILIFGTLITMLVFSSCGDDNNNEMLTPVTMAELAASAPQLERGYDLGLTMEVEGVRNGQYPYNERLVYLTAFGNEQWVIYLKEDQNWPTSDRLITLNGVYLTTTDLDTEDREFQILVDAEIVEQ